jgi:hypothetical protein
MNLINQVDFRIFWRDALLSNIEEVVKIFEMEPVQSIYFKVPFLAEISTLVLQVIMSTK